MLQHWGWGEGCAGERGWINCSIIPSICRHRLCCSKHCSKVELKDGLCHGDLEFAMKQLQRESSVVSNSCISSLLRLFFSVGNAMVQHGFCLLREIQMGIM